MVAPHRTLKRCLVALAAAASVLAALTPTATASSPARLLVRVDKGLGFATTGFQVRTAGGRLVGRISTGNVVPATAAAESPDGRHVGFVGTDGYLWVVTRDGKHLRRLVAANPAVTPTWSPGGRSLAVEDPDTGYAAIVAWPSGRMTETRLWGVNGPAFSPDGWLWSTGNAGNVQIQGVPPGGVGTPQPWGPPAADNPLYSNSQSLAISPNGRIAAYLGFREVPRARAALFEQPRGGSERELLAVPGPDYTTPGGRLAFSPGGRWLAVDWSNLFTRPQLWLVPAGGGAPRIVAPTTALFAQPAWSPDGRTVAIDLPHGVALVARDGSVRRPRGLRRALNPSWTTGTGTRTGRGPHLPLRRLRLRLPTLSVGRGGGIVDAHGRQVMLRGVNVNALVAYQRRGRFAPVFGLMHGDPARMASIGWDAVRLAISWSRVEPSPGRFDDRYLARVATTVRRLAHAGIYSIIDMHQDAWSATLGARPGEHCPLSEKAIGYDGAPAWATLVPRQAPRCWSRTREANPAVMAAWVAFFANAKHIETRYVAMWRHVARYFARQTGVAGFDLMNEPNSFGALEDHRLSAMYAGALRAIRAGERARHGPAHLIFFEPSVTFSSPQFGPGGVFGGVIGPPPDFARDRDTVYAPHLYTGGFDNGPITKQAFAQVARQARGLRHAPVVLGEWGTNPGRAAGGDPYFLDHQALEDSYRFGAFLWVWRESCGEPGASSPVWGEFNVDCHTNRVTGERSALISQLTRGYVRAAAGHLRQMRWSPRARVLTASGRGHRGAGEMIAFLPPGPRPRVRDRGLRREYVAHAPGGGWYFIATARGGSWSFTATA